MHSHKIAHIINFFKNIFLNFLFRANPDLVLKFWMRVKHLRPIVSESIYIQHPMELVENKMIDLYIFSNLERYKIFNEPELLSGDYMSEIYLSAQEGQRFNSVNFIYLDTDTLSEGFFNEIASIDNSNLKIFLGQIESFSNESGEWKWDELVEKISKIEKSFFVGLLTDSVYDLHKLYTLYLNKIFKQSFFIAIDQDNEFYNELLKKTLFYGPTFLPISNQSLGELNKKLKFDRNTFIEGIDFIGKIYPYRKKMLKKILQSSQYMNFPENLGFIKNRSRITSYVDYLLSLHISEFVLDLSRANGVPIKQQKSRIIESLIVGTPVLTDNKNFKCDFLNQNDFIISYKDLKSIDFLVQNFRSSKKAHKESRISMSKSSQKYVQEHFWNLFFKGLSDSLNV